MLKRAFDILASGVALLLLAPLLLLLAVWIRLDSPGSVLSRQVRVGRGRREFTLLKFRTMVVGASGLGLAMPVDDRDPRLTRLGFALRKLGLEDLPQLWNVLVGDMSVVGPRPEVPRFVQRYDATQRAALRVRPGLVDPALFARGGQIPVVVAGTESERQYVESFLPATLAANLAYLKTSDTTSDLRLALRSLGHQLARALDVSSVQKGLRLRREAALSSVRIPALPGGALGVK